MAAAADGDPLLLGRTNTAMRLTVLESGSSLEDGGLSVIGRRNGVAGSGNSSGVIGSGTFGVIGSGTTGVAGVGTTGVSGFGSTGVRGSGRNLGVAGNGPFGGVIGGSGSLGAGVAGNGGTGVLGTAVAFVRDGIGVRGQADSGMSAKGVAGVSREGFAGYFAGRVYATDSLTTEGTLSVAARHPDGTRRRLDSPASPVSYFQDFGKATLVRGRASVPLDPDFAALVQTDDYLVFLTPEARTSGLFVFRKTPTGFEVRDRDEDDDQGVLFAWQVVARRREMTGAAVRLEPLAVPTPVAQLPLMPELPPEPELPQLPQATP